MAVPAETSNGDVTSWIPLQTIFTPSAGCESIFRLNGPSLVAFDPGYGLDIDTAIKCAPSAVTTWWEQARLGVGGDAHTVLSIQPLTCPNQWTTVGTYVKNKSSTQIMCCPSGYSNPDAISGPVNGNCISEVTKGVVLTYASTAGGDSTDWTTKTTKLALASSVGAIAVVGWNVAIAAPTSSSSISSTSLTSSPSLSLSWSSLSLLPSSSSSTPAPITTPAPAQTSTTSANPPAANTSLSTGVKIGIGLGAALGIIGVLAIILAVTIMYRRGRKIPSDSATPAMTPAAFYAADGKPPPPHQQQQQYHDTVYELPNGHEPTEMPHSQDRSPVEMYTSSRDF